MSTVHSSWPNGRVCIAGESRPTLRRNFQPSGAYAGASTSVKPNLAAFLRNAAIARPRVRRSDRVCKFPLSSYHNRSVRLHPQE
jgi:hypothetical protein